MAEDIFYWLALSLTPGVGSILIKRLLDRFKTLEAVFRASLKELVRIEGLGERVAGEIQKGPSEKVVKRELSLLEKTGGRIVTLKDDDYPARLKDIYDPPALLYLRGELKRDDELAVAIVGSRKTSAYGREVTEKIGEDLARHGVTVVSGMARGIDSVAHKGALQGGGRTIAVLGCGVDVIYPSENRNLFYQIIERGGYPFRISNGVSSRGRAFPEKKSDHQRSFHWSGDRPGQRGEWLPDYRRLRVRARERSLCRSGQCRSRGQSWHESVDQRGGKAGGVQ